MENVSEGKKKAGYSVQNSKSMNLYLLAKDNPYFSLKA